jgi:hypothetical protein
MLEELAGEVVDFLEEGMAAGRFNEQDVKSQKNALEKFFSNNLYSPINNELAVLDGSINSPHNWGLAKWLGTLRRVTRMSKMGGSVITQLSDINPYAANLMRSHAVSATKAIAEPLQIIGKNMAGKITPLQKSELAYTGVINRMNIEQSAVGRYSVTDGEMGLFTQLQTRFFNWNLMSPLTEGTRLSAGVGNTARMGEWQELGWQRLPQEVKAMLRQYGISKSEWDTMREGPVLTNDGYKFFGAQNIDGLDSSYIAAYLTRKGRRVTPSSIEKTRHKFKDMILNFHTDQAMMMVLEPTDLERSKMLMGAQRGTWGGDLIWRSILELKGFPMAFLFRTMGPEWRAGRRGRAIAGVATRGVVGAISGITRLFLMMTFSGYVSNVISDLLKGKNPYVPMRDDKEFFWKHFLNAATRGGGLSILGDLLFGETNRYGGGLSSIILGPTVGGMGGDAYDIIIRLRDGDPVASSAVNFAINNTPYANLFYTRWLMDFFLLNELQEWASPGRARRLERSLKRERGQEYFEWRRPTEFQMG